MTPFTRLTPMTLALLLLVGGCAPATLNPGSGGPPNSEKPAAPKLMTVAIMGTPKAFGLAANLSAVPGEDELTELVNSGLSTLDNQDRVRPKLAETIPTIENGLWKVSTDGRMETTFRIRPGAQWHDGVPVTVDDLVFTSQVIVDKDLAIAAHLEYRSIESIETPDAHTLTLKWKTPYLHADSILNSRDSPLPKHLLAQPYAENKASFLDLPYWHEQFVGAGPYRVREWVLGTHVALEANDQYVLGRPKIDEVDVRFIPDSNTLVANVLAGAVELTMGRGIAIEQGLEVRDQWRNGRVITAVAIPMIMYPQFRNPVPAVMADVRFRRALLHAIDRQKMVDTLLGGLSRVAYGALYLSDEDQKDLASSITRYEYDPKRAAQLIEELEYRKGPDGMFRDAADRSLSVDLATTPTNAIQLSTQLVVADDWQRAGVGVDQIVVPQQQVQDPRYKIDFRAFSLRKQPITLDRLEVQFHSGQIPTLENNIRGSNFAAYSNSDLDALIDKFFTTVPRGQRMEGAAQIMHHLTDQVVIFGLYYDVEVVLINHRVKDVIGRGVGSGESWNSELWDVAS